MRFSVVVMVTGCWTATPVSPALPISKPAPRPAVALPSPRSAEVGIFTLTGFVASDEIPMYMDPTFGWRIQLDCANGDVIRVREEFRLPKPGVWSPSPNLEIRDEGRIARFRGEAICGDDGWIEKGWSLSPGDPPGDWVIKVTPAGYKTTTFHATFLETP
ncbi:MAG: hypothetical protein SFX73_04810 [Kofleriaceae bacterium]|nr:hypothetical protein [Kofleriaceae bacterium]